MARVTIEFDTATESLEDVLQSLNFSPLVQVPLQVVTLPAQPTVVDTPPAPEPTAPAAPLPPEVQEFVGNGLDADGVPHDERIHSKGGNKTKQGRWKRLRGIEDDLYNSVMAELRDATGFPTVPDAPAVPGAPPAPPAPVALTWPEVNAKLAAFSQGDIQKNMPIMLEVLGKHGIEGYPLLSTRSDLWATILSDLGID